MKLGIGIDTGGTYTDAVIYDFESKKILGGAKSLTTKNDLSIGILGALDGLPAELVKTAEVISLSTTLATNACVEDKGGRAKLIFFGGDPQVIDRNGPKYGLPKSDEIYIQESYSSFSGESSREIDWELFRREIENGYDEYDGVGIIEMNSMRNGAAGEKKAKAIFEEKYDIPAVCGHELFSELNSLRRGAGTLLNAGLSPVIKEFLVSVRKALEVRGIHPKSLVIVRSDGSLMSEEFASVRPVETLLCGPAASAMGCTSLAGRQNCVVVDMGGTTTDIALISNGIPVKMTNGVSVGRWKTFVNGLYVKTFGLGGDSAVHYNGNKLFLEEYRVTPLCIAASKYPSVIGNLEKMTPKKHTRFLYEHYMLVKDIENSARYTEEEKAFCRVLREKPLPAPDAAAAVGKDIYSLRAERLVKDGIVQICGFTPTDAMHIKGDFTKYSRKAASLAADFIAYNLDISVDELCGRVYDEVKRKLYLGISRALLENRYPDLGKNGISEDIERFLLDNYNAFREGRHDPLLTTAMKTDYALVGMGAPIQVFLPEVAEMLGTEAVIPENHEVANALGAIVGNISASVTVEILPDNTADGICGYMVYGDGGKITFETHEEAVEYAECEARRQVAEELVRRGGSGEFSVTCTAVTDEAAGTEGTVYIGTSVTAYGTAMMGF